MRIKLLFLLLFSFCRYCTYAQSVLIEGNVTSAKGHQPISFATIGIKNKSIGTVANENGTFHLLIPDSLASLGERLIISSVGYKQAIISITQFKQGRQTISLIPSVFRLKEVTVKPEKYKTKVFGRTGSSTIMTANMFTERSLVSDNLGKEQAVILPIDKHCFIKDFNMLVTFNRFESVKFRLNFYNVKDGLPDQLIVNQDILFDVTQKSGWVKIDLSKYNIYLNGYSKIAVAIQWVKSVKTDTTTKSSFGVSVIPVPLHALYFRDKSQAAWKKISPAYAAFNITADSFKPNGEKETDLKEKDEKEELGDSVKNYLNYTRFAEEAIASGYGNNSKVGKYVQLATTQIYYESYGSGEPLLLLHGNSGSIAAFYKQIPTLSKQFRVIAVDTRAQGKSISSSNEPLTYNLFAEDMKVLLDSLHIKQANIVGWSDGGNTGLIMAIKYPSYVKGLAVMGANLDPSGVDPNLLSNIKIQINQLNRATDKQSVNQKRLLTLLVNEPHIDDNELQTIKSPVLVMAGEKDVIKAVHTQEIADHIKGSKLFIIKDATHYAPQEKPQEFNQAIMDFLKR